jgi:hypothetical protein
MIMKRVTLMSIVLTSMAACAGGWPHTDTQADDARFQAAHERVSIDCLGRTSCEAIWKRTRDYVARYSATRISKADDTAIETERPHEFGVLYLWASRTLVPGDPEASRIRLNVMCRGMVKSDGTRGWLYATCVRQVTPVELGFRDYATAED